MDRKAWLTDTQNHRTKHEHCQVNVQRHCSQAGPPLPAARGVSGSTWRQPAQGLRRWKASRNQARLDPPSLAGVALLRALIERLREKPNSWAGASLMSDSVGRVGRCHLRAMLAAAALFAAVLAGQDPARAAGACALIPNDSMPSEKMLQCGENLTVRAAPGARYQPLYKKGDPLPVAIRLNDGALLIEFHPASQMGRRLSNSDAARHCRGPRHEMGDGRHESRKPPRS